MPGDLTLANLPDPEYEGILAIDELEVDGDNPNEMTDEQFGLLCDRMRENGWLGGSIITNTEGLIADGEHRWRAAQEIGLAEVPVRQFELTDAKRRLWRQELNKIHGEHDTKRDALEYDQLLSEGYTEEVEALTDAADEDLDELLEEIRVETSKPAQYEYDPEHNVYFEDCVEGMRERLDDNSVDMVFTSPPYNIEKEASGDRRSENVSYDDNKTDAEFRKFLSGVFDELVRVIRPEGHIFINIAHDYSKSNITPSTWIVDILPAPLRSIIIWNKSVVNHGHLPGRGQFFDNYEPIYHFSPKESPLNGRGDKGVWECPTANIEDRDYGPHPAPYSVALVERAIDATTQKENIILDPFMGSGTTAVAAIQNDRDYVGFELDEQGAYKPIIERRISEAKRAKEATVNQEE